MIESINCPTSTPKTAKAEKARHEMMVETTKEISPILLWMCWTKGHFQSHRSETLGVMTRSFQFHLAKQQPPRTSWICDVNPGVTLSNKFSKATKWTSLGFPPVKLWKLIYIDRKDHGLVLWDNRHQSLTTQNQSISAFGSHISASVRCITRATYEYQAYQHMLCLKSLKVWSISNMIWTTTCPTS